MKKMNWLYILGIIIIISLFIIITIINNKKKLEPKTIKYGQLEIIEQEMGDTGLDPDDITEEEIQYDTQYPNVMFEDKNEDLQALIDQNVFPYLKKPDMLTGIAITFKENNCDDVTTVVLDASTIKYEKNRLYLTVYNKDNELQTVTCIYDKLQQKLFYKYNR